MPAEIIDLLDEGSSSSSPQLQHEELQGTDTDEEESDTELYVGSDDDTNIFKEVLEDFFAAVEAFGSFAVSGKIPGDISTGLVIHGIGPIAFPLLELQAKDIIRVCHRAPFGKGSETLIDESVRKTWELNPDQFELSNPAWQVTLRKITQKAAQELGCGSESCVRPSLYKMLLYEKGALFKPHKDTEKEPGMFGTLVICLPSIYTGGAVVASHRGQSKILEAESPSLSHSFISWYGDVTHEVQPILSGYRLVLVYNLLQGRSGPSPSASLNLHDRRRLGRILDAWGRGSKKSRSRAPEALVYKLDHQYTDANLKLQTLKGLDKVKAQYLHELCAKAGLCFYLARMEKSKYGGVEDDSFGGGGGGYYDDEEDEYEEEDDDEEEDEEERGRVHRRSSKFHEMEDVLEESISIKRLIDPDGQLLAEDVGIDEDMIIQEDPFERDPDDEDYEGWTGNEGASATHWINNLVKKVNVKSTTFHDRIEAIRSIEMGHTEGCKELGEDGAELNDLWKEWVSQQYKAILTSLDAPVRNDGPRMARLVTQHPEVLDYQRCAVIAEQYAFNSAFLASFAVAIIDKRSEDHANATFSTIVSVLIKNFTVECRATTKRASPGTSTDGREAQCLMDGHDLSRLIEYLRCTAQFDEVNQLREKLIRDADNCELVAFEAFYIPLLTDLASKLPTNSEHCEVYQPLYRKVLCSYIRRYVQTEPPRGNLAKQLEGCGSSRCADCRDLDRFLGDPKRKSAFFVVDKGRRHHLHKQLNDTEHSHTTRGYNQLVVTKGSSAHDIKHENWKKRSQNAREKIQAFDQDVLKDLLGPDYDDVIALRPGKKRPVVIDLT
ncbi:MAG: hypothetical protein Q9220_003339 [cf. Caloplaca sp. 1 TL-2023]